jgi:antitoxin component YwqK of YwqJK toxin-antitoxin module
MGLLHDAYTALLSGLTYKTGNEIHWHDNNGNQITIEPENTENNNYIIRRYHDNGSIYWEMKYCDGKLCRHIGWFRNGMKHWELEYCNGKRKEIKYWNIHGIEWTP